jgi:hypothetical protein
MEFFNNVAISDDDRAVARQKRSMNVNSKALISRSLIIERIAECFVVKE